MGLLTRQGSAHNFSTLLYGNFTLKSILFTMQIFSSAKYLRLDITSRRSTYSASAPKAKFGQ